MYVSNRELNRILTFIRIRFKRAGSKFFYAWVCELQKKRYLKTGKKALHWHIAVIAPAGGLPDVAFCPDNKKHYVVLSEGSIISSFELYKSWGRGQVLCQYARYNVSGYLGKYLTKDNDSLADFDLSLSRLRRFGCSNMGRLRWPEWMQRDLEECQTRGVPVDELMVKREGSVVRLYEKPSLGLVSLVNSGILRKRFNCAANTGIRVAELRSPWELVE